MLQKTILILLLIFTISCNSSNDKEKELLKKELELAKRELEIKKKEAEIREEGKPVYKDFSDRIIKNKSHEPRRTVSAPKPIKPNSYYRNDTEQLKLEKNNPANYLSLDYKFRLGLINMIMDYSVKNRAKFTTYRNIELELVFFNKNKKRIGTKIITVPNTISPMKTKSKTIRFKAPIGANEGKAYIKSIRVVN